MWAMLNFRKYEIKAYFGSIFPKKNKLDGKERKKICFFSGSRFLWMKSDGIRFKLKYGVTK